MNNGLEQSLLYNSYCIKTDVADLPLFSYCNEYLCGLDKILDSMFNVVKEAQNFFDEQYAKPIFNQKIKKHYTSYKSLSSSPVLFYVQLKFIREQEDGYIYFSLINFDDNDIDNLKII